MLGKFEGAPKWLRILIPTALIVVWFGVSAVGGPYFGKIEEVADNGFAGFLPKSAESTKVNKQLEKFQDDTTLPAIVLFHSDKKFSKADVSTIDKTAEELECAEGISEDPSPAVLSEDGKAVLVAVPVDSGSELELVTANIERIYSEVDIEGASFHVTGPAAFAAGLNKAFAGIDGILLLTALAVVFVILIVVYRSVLLPIIVLLTSIFALSASIMLVWWLAKNDIVSLNGQVQGILFILVIGAATDYSLLFVSRFRESLYENASKLHAIAESYKGAFEPIIASGGTVIVGLMCLLLSDLESNKALAPVGSIGVAFAMISALTFLPAVLYAFGRGSFWPFMPSTEPKQVKKHKERLAKGLWHKVGNLVQTHGRAAWIASTVALLVLAMFSTQLKADGVEQSDLILGQSDARDGQEILNDHFPGGSGSPVQIVAQDDNWEDVVKLVDADKGIDGIVAVAINSPSGTMPVGKAADEFMKEFRAKVEAEANIPKQTPNYELIIDSAVDNANPFGASQARSEDGQILLQATLLKEPDSQYSKDTVVRLRDKLDDVSRDVLVGGPTAIQQDTITASKRDREIIIPTVLIAITIILMVLLRAVVAPLLLLASTVLSFAATLGVAALLFNGVMNFPGADPSVVLFGFVFLVALGIDYNIFLMTRVREETVKHGTAKGVIKGLVVTGSVITSAGIVLAATFAALGVIPILFLFQIAFIVAFGVLLDTFVVRSLLVPALIRDIGPFVWWPSKLKSKK
ncbi:MAG TPA: MMPL family transporter [Candidatus Saccharibacteria bacterium]|nr:MMPL family transporter [Candidatus Saccharibacteria bacterium]